MIDKLEKNPNLTAVICIGPDLISMRVSSLKNRRIVDFDFLEMPINLGHEIFNKGKISFDSIKNISKIIDNYLKVLNEYKILKFKVVASSFFLEAKNSEYVIDQLKIHNNITLEVLEESQEKSLIYYQILKKDVGKVDDQKYTLISYVGASTVGIALCKGKNVIFNQNVKVGSIKLYDLLSKVQNETSDYHTVFEEYLDRIISRINVPIDSSLVSTIIFSGRQVNLLKKFCSMDKKSKCLDIDKDRFCDFYSKIKDVSYKVISDRYGISLSEAEILFVSFAIYKRILNFAPKAKISISTAKFWDTIVLSSLNFKEEVNYKNHLYACGISCARTIAKHYYCDTLHIEETLNISKLIFDKMKGIHGLDDRKRLLLEMSIILHEVGYYINSKNPRMSTFDIIKNLDLYGLKKDEVLLISNIVKYDELSEPTLYDSEYLCFSKRNKLIISKLIAIFRISNALDKAKKQKIKSLKIKLLDEKILITGKTDENVYLEKWAFDKCTPFFKEVFGLKPQLIVKTLLF